jgi:hypothetical protein
MAVLARGSKGAPGTAAGRVDDPAAGLMLGEIRTGLLQNSGPIRSDVAATLLALMPQQMVRQWSRPVRHAASPEVLTGVDCVLPSAINRELRAVGTMATDVRITGGHIVQAATRVRLVAAREHRRLPWSHYLTAPGTAETWGAVRDADIVTGFFRGQSRPETLDLASPSAHRMNTLQASGLLDGAHTYRPERTRLRWAAAVTDGPLGVTFSLESPQVHTLWLEVPPELIAGVASLCQDVALHDWLLSSVIALIDRADVGTRDRRAVVKTLAPGIDHLLHAWLPGARIGDELMTYWAEIDRRSGFSRQWDAAVQQIRDQVALATVELAAAGQSGAVRQTVQLP